MSVWYPHITEWGYYNPIKSGSIDGTDEKPHDKALLRASNSKYSPNPLAYPERIFKLWPDNKLVPEACLFVGRLPPDIDISALSRVFRRLFVASKSHHRANIVKNEVFRSQSLSHTSASHFSSSRSSSQVDSKLALWPLFRLVTDVITGDSKGYGFAWFRKPKHARRFLLFWRELKKSDNRNLNRHMSQSDFDYAASRHRIYSSCNLADVFHGISGWDNIVIEQSFSRTVDGWRPRRLGGGLGGRKESGQLRFGGIERPFRRPFQKKYSSL